MMQAEDLRKQVLLLDQTSMGMLKERFEPIFKNLFELGGHTSQGVRLQNGTGTIRIDHLQEGLFEACRRVGVKVVLGAKCTSLVPSGQTGFEGVIVG